MSSAPREGPSLFDAARAAGVPFSKEAFPADGSVRANGLRFHYLEWGQTNMPPLLMLHGLAQTCHMWDLAALSLCDRFRVIALDQRGHGDTDWAPDGRYSVDDHQGDLHAIVRKLRLKDLVIVGLSMGGRNAFVYAAEHPELLRGLVIVDAAPEHQRSGAERVRRFVEGPDEFDSMDDFVARVHGYNPRRPLEQVRGSLRHNLKQLPSGKWTWKYDRALRSADRFTAPDPALTRRLWRCAERVQCPALVVRGAHSNVVSQETAELTCRRMPDAPAGRGRGRRAPGAGRQPGWVPEGARRLPARPAVDGAPQAGIWRRVVRGHRRSAPGGRRSAGRSAPHAARTGPPIREGSGCPGLEGE